MKKLLSILILTVITLACTFGLVACGGEKPLPTTPTAGIVYELSADGNYAEVIDYTGTDKEILIADTYNDKPVKTVFSNSFKGKNITTIVIPDSIEKIGESAFDGCENLSRIVIGKGVTSIGDQAFSGCSSLTSVTIGNSVTSIGSAAFQYCRSLTSVTIGNSVTSIGREAFAYCHSSLYTTENSLKYVKANDNPYYILIESTNKNLSTYQINSNTKHIASDVFQNCERLTTIEIPNSVASIGRWAFSNCSSLTSIYFNGDVNKWVEIEGLSNIMSSSRTLYINNQKPTEIVLDTATKITGSAFAYCDSLTSVTIPNSVTSIGSNAFSGCSSLTSVTIGDSVTSIGNYAFYYCDSLTSVTIGNSVTSIGNYAFYNCYSLTSVTIPNSVTSIGDYAFSGCSKLTSIVIPNSVTSIGEYAFSGCSSLTIYCKAESKPSGWDNYWNSSRPVVWGYKG